MKHLTLASRPAEAQTFQDYWNLGWNFGWCLGYQLTAAKNGGSAPAECDEYLGMK